MVHFKLLKSYSQYHLSYYLLGVSSYHIQDSLIAGAWKEILMIVEIFEMGKRSNWSDSNKVCDAWLLSIKEPRSDFPYETFLNLHPDWNEQKLNQFEEMETARNCKDDSSSQGSQITIITDEKESCKPTCSISENERLITDFF